MVAITTLVLGLAAAAGVSAAPAATDVATECWGQKPLITYEKLGADIVDFCKTVHSNIPNGGMYGNYADGVSFELLYGGPKCGANSGHVSAEKCAGLFSPLKTTCGDVRGKTHGGKTHTGCWTAIAVVQ